MTAAAAGGGRGGARPLALAAALALVLAAPAPAPAAAAGGCPPELLGRLLDQGYGKEEILRLCGDGGSGAAAGGPGRAAGDPSVATAYARLRQLTGRLERECRSGPRAGAGGGTGPCDLHAQYADILARWSAGQAKCDAGDAAACGVLAEAAAQFLAVDP